MISDCAKIDKKLALMTHRRCMQRREREPFVRNVSEEDAIERKGEKISHF